MRQGVTSRVREGRVGERMTDEKSVSDTHLEKVTKKRERLIK